MRILAFLLLSTLSLVAQARPVLLISIDGFTPTYLELYAPPFLSQLVKKGAYSTHMKPVFPSKTFPNHISIVTGVYPQKHGIVHNSFYHPIINRDYRFGLGKEDSRWVTGKPIWTLAEQHGITAATYFWPESEGKIDGILPTYMVPYDGSVPNDMRLSQIVDWLSLPKAQQPQFMTTYFSVVDSAGHGFGIHSEQAKTAVMEVDAALDNFYQTLVDKNLTDLDIIIVSDHGMVALDPQKAMLMEDFNLSDQLTRVMHSQTQILIYERDSKRLAQAKAQLKAAANGRFEVYTKGHYPEHWHLDMDLVQIPDLIASAYAPYSFTAKPKTFSPKEKQTISHSTHGFDPKFTPEMDAIFIAYGPSFHSTHIEQFQNVDVMPLMLKLLGIPAPSHLDGSIDSLESILK